MTEASPLRRSAALARASDDRAPLGLLMLDDPWAPAAAVKSPYLATRIVDGCTVDRLIYAPDDAVEAAMVEASRLLVRDGARAITGNCGFMVRHQDAVKNAVDVPVMLSSLLLAPLLLTCVGDNSKLGIITASVPSMTDDLLRKAGVLNSERTVLGDLGDKPGFRSAYLDCVTFPDLSVIEQEVLTTAKELVASYPDVGLILLECTVLPAFAGAIREIVDVPVLDIVSLMDLFVQGFAPHTKNPVA
jgi:Asp/Glu/hydantoin racemase